MYYTICYTAVSIYQSMNNIVVKCVGGSAEQLLWLNTQGAESELWSNHGWTDRHKSMHMSPPCLGTGVRNDLYKVHCKQVKYSSTLPNKHSAQSNTPLKWTILIGPQHTPLFLLLFKQNILFINSPSVLVCETYVVNHLVGTRLRCAPPTCVLHHRAALCTMAFFIC